MGNSSQTTGSIKSKYSTLLQQYNLFSVPKQYQTHLNNINQTSQQNFISVNGKRYLKGNFYTNKYFLNPSQSEKQIQQYFIRHQSKQSNLFPIVKVIGLKQIQQNNLCSIYKWYCVITQDIVLLNSIQNNLSYQQCVYLLFQCLMGFYYLYVKHSNFQINDKMIGLNNQGKVKVWLHQNFAQNKPQFHHLDLQVTRNISQESLKNQKQKNLLYQIHMIKNIIKIINKKYKSTQDTFSKLLQEKIKIYFPDFNIQKVGFQGLLKFLSEYQQKDGDSLFIPNKIKVTRQYQSKLPQRQSFSVRLRKAIISYRAEKQQQLKETIINYRAEKQQQLKESQKTYSTGVEGNTLKKYESQQKLIYSDINNLKSVNFTYQSPSYLIKNYSSFSSTYYNKNNSGLRYTNNQYRASDYESQLQPLSKDLRDTYYKSTGDSFFYQTSYRNLGQSDSFNKLSHSISQNLFNQKYQYDLNNKYHLTSVPSSNKFQNTNSSYKQNIYTKYLIKNSSNNRISEEYEPQSIRPSLMTIKVDSKNIQQNDHKNEKEQQNYDWASVYSSQNNYIYIPQNYYNNYRSNTNNQDNKRNNNLDEYRQSVYIQDENIITPNIQSRLTQNLYSIGLSREYPEKKFNKQH